MEPPYVQGLLSMEFFRREYWSGWPFPSPGDLPDPGSEAGSPALQADFLSSETLGKSPQFSKERGLVGQSDSCTNNSMSQCGTNASLRTLCSCHIVLRALSFELKKLSEDRVLSQTKHFWKFL